MKSMRFSDIEHVRDGRQRPPASFSLERLTVLVLTLGLGLPILILLLHRATPNTPLGYIVLPVLLGGLLPLSRVLQGRLEVSTRFDASHLAGALHEEVIKLGYVQAESGAGTVRYRSRPLGWLRRRARDIFVTVYEHGLEVTGPVPALRALRRSMER